MTKDTKAPEDKEVQEDTTAAEDKESPEGSPEGNASEKDTQKQEPAEEAEPSVAELHQEDERPSNKKPESVPFKRFMKEKEKRKNLEKELESLKAQKEEDDDDDSDVEKDPEVSKLANEVEEMKLKERQRQLNAAFEKSFGQALENLPEYKDIVNPEVIRRMAFDPANKSKTYRQLIEDAYGNAVKGGQRTVETTTPRGGAKDSKLDLKRAETDAEYRKEVLRDPELKKQYNEGLTERIPI